MTLDNFLDYALGGTTTQYQKFFRNIETFNITQKQLNEAAEIAAKSTTPEKAAQLFYDEIVKAADTNKVFTRNQLESIPVVNNNDQKRMIADQIEENRRIKEELDVTKKTNKIEVSPLKINQAKNIVKLSSKSSLDETLFNQLENALDSAPSIKFSYGSKAPQTPKQFLNEIGNDMYDVVYINGTYAKFDNATGRMLYSDGTNQYFIHFETDINVSNVDELINTRVTQFRNYLGLNGPQTIELKHGLGNVVTNPDKTTFIGKTDETILLKKQFGNFKHYKVGESPGAVNLLNMPDTYWNPSTWFEDYNRDWMLRAIERGDDIYIASPINKLNLINETDLGVNYGSYFANELNELVKAGNWTPYEASVWEQHYMEKHGGKVKLENKINVITEGKYNQYKHLHNPC